MAANVGKILGDVGAGLNAIYGEPAPAPSVTVVDDGMPEWVLYAGAAVVFLVVLVLIVVAVKK